MSGSAEVDVVEEESSAGVAVGGMTGGVSVSDEVEGGTGVGLSCVGGFGGVVDVKCEVVGSEDGQGDEKEGGEKNSVCEGCELVGGGTETVGTGGLFRRSASEAESWRTSCWRALNPCVVVRLCCSRFCVVLALSKEVRRRHSRSSDIALVCCSMKVRR